MAKIFPEICPTDATTGEKRLFEVFKNKLPEGFIVWYEPRITENRKSDFLIYGPNFGLLVIEVKDWIIDNIIEADQNVFVIQRRPNASRENYRSPLVQAENYMYSLKEVLQRDPTFINPTGEHQGKLSFPLGHGVIMTNINNIQAERRNLISLLPTEQIIYCNDCLNWDNIRPNNLVNKLHQMFLNRRFAFEPFNDSQLSILQGILWPTIRKNTPPRPIPAPTPVRSEELSGTIRQHYRIIRKLSSGSFGITYIAEDLDLPNSPHCVVKRFRLVASDVGTYSKAKEGFEREAQSLQRLGEDRNIPRLYAHFEENGEFFLIQEYIDGVTLADKIDQKMGGEWSGSEVKDVLKKILTPLKYVHDNNMIHRDIKPTNLIYRNDKNIALIDFGAVKSIIEEEARGTIIGTYGYMSPEQARGLVTSSSDIYSVGIVAIELLTGTLIRNLTDPSLGEINWVDRCPNLDTSLKDVISKMISARYQDRYQNAEEALTALDGINDGTIRQGTGTIKQLNGSRGLGRDSNPPNPDPPKLPNKPKSKRKIWPISVGALAVATLAGITFPYFTKLKLEQESLTVGILWTPESYQPLAEYIEKNTVPSNFFDYLFGKKIRVIVNGDKSLSYDEARSRMGDKQWDIAFTVSPINSIFAKDQGYTYSAGMFPGSSSYQSGLFVNSNSPIKSIDDIRENTTVALGNFNSASSFYMPVYDLYGKKISTTTGHRGQNIIKLVKSGDADVGAAAIGDSIRKDDPDLKIIKVSREIPGSGVYLSPNFSSSEQKGLTKLMLKAPTEIKKEANYGDQPEPDYTEFRKIVERVNEVLICSNFDENPVNLGCSVNTSFINIEGTINGITAQNKDVILKVQTKEGDIYSVKIPESLLKDIFGTDNLADIQQKMIKVNAIAQNDNQEITINQARQIQLIKANQVSFQNNQSKESKIKINLKEASLVSATVTEVQDGDTITVDAQGQSNKIRLACLDAPETAQAPWGKQSTEFINESIPVGTTIFYNQVDTDKYDRTVAEVYKGEELVNLQLLKTGNAVVYHQYLGNCPDNKEKYLAAESEAKEQKKGLWNQDKVCLPWDFRRKKCE